MFLRKIGLPAQRKFFVGELTASVFLSNTKGFSEEEANLLAEKSGGQKVKFAVEVTEGKVSIKAKVQGNSS